MNVQDLQKDWENFGSKDPMWAVLTDDADYGRQWDPEEFLALGRADVDAWMTRLRGLGGGAQHARALDFGCGVGRLSQGLARYYDEVVGVDISRPMLEAARRHNRFPEKVAFVQNSRADLSQFQSGSFDLVLSHIVLQHLRPQLALGYIAEFLRVVRPGGSLVFQIPTARIRRRWRYRLVRAAPGLVALYRRLRHGNVPHREMHAVAQGRVKDVIARGGGVILAVDRDEAAGPEFLSSVFYVSRQR